VRPAYFRDKYGVDVLRRFAEPLRTLQAEGYLAAADAEQVTLTRSGLLRADVLIRRFFLPQHSSVRYT
jgi:hypothetical protein